MLSFSLLPRGLILLLLSPAPHPIHALPSKIDPGFLLDSDNSYRTYREKYKCLTEECYVYYGVDAVYEGNCSVILHSPNAWSASTGLGERDHKHPLILPGKLYLGPTHSYGLRNFDSNDIFVALDAEARVAEGSPTSRISYMTSIFPAYLLNGIRGKEGRVLWNVTAEAIMDDMEGDRSYVYIGGELRSSLFFPLEDVTNQLKLYWPTGWSSSLAMTGRTGRVVDTNGKENYLYSKPPMGGRQSEKPYKMRFNGIVEEETARVNFTVTDYCSRAVACKSWDGRHHFNYTVVFEGVNRAGGIGKWPKPVMEIHQDKMLFTDGRVGTITEVEDTQEDCKLVCGFLRLLDSVSSLYLGVILYGVVCLGLVLFFVRLMCFRRNLCI